MSKSRNIDYDAFRFCLTAELESRLSAYGSKVTEEKCSDYYKLQFAYLKLPVWSEQEYKNCASVVTDSLVRFEPSFLNGSSRSYSFCHNGGRKEKRPFDGRSTFILDDSGRSLGFSCGKEPAAQDRPALFYKAGDTLKLLDISDAWLGTGAMGIKYIDSMKTVCDFISANRAKKWTDLFDSSEEKFEVLYRPILEALKTELESQCMRHSNAAAAMLNHFFGIEDYYLIALQPDSKKARISAFGLNGKLSYGETYAEELLPTELVDISYKERTNSVSNTTLQLTFDRGWVMNMRLRTTDQNVSVGPRLEIDFKGSRPYKLKVAEVQWK